MARPIALSLVLAWHLILPGAVVVAAAKATSGDEPTLQVAQSEPQPPAQPSEPPSETPANETQPDQQVAPPAPDSELGVEPPPDDPEESTSLGEIPTVETVELNADLAKRALDAYVMVRDKYKDANLEEYENLQDFVDETDVGKQFETDIKSYGFNDVNQWNIAVTSVGLAYSAIIDDQSADILQQIEDIKKDDTIAQDMKDRMVASLNAIIPSDNNKAVVTEMMKDPATSENLKLLGEEQAEE